MDNNVYLRWLELSRRGEFVCHNAHIEFIIKSYASRPYHSLNHIFDMLEKFDKFQHIVPNPVEAELIVWFHDIAKTEAESADIAKAILTEAEFHGDISMICDGILATDHIACRMEDFWKDWPINKMVTIMTVCDLDLSVLGSDRAGYDAYKNGIHQEYAHIPEKDFLEGRLKILQYFNSPKPVFWTEHLRVTFETRARINMAFEITAIQKRLAELTSS